MVTFNLDASEQFKTEKFLFTQDWSQENKNLIDCGAELEPESTEMWYEPNICTRWEKTHYLYQQIMHQPSPFKDHTMLSKLYALQKPRNN